LSATISNSKVSFHETRTCGHEPCTTLDETHILVVEGALTRGKSEKMRTLED